MLAELRASSQSEHQLVIEYTETINNLEARMLALRKQFEHSVRTAHAARRHFASTRHAVVWWSCVLEDDA